jgi:transposase
MLPHQAVGATHHLPTGRPHGFVLLKWRWIVERTFGWLNLSRRLSTDYEVLPASSERGTLWLAMLSIRLQRLARQR